MTLHLHLSSKMRDGVALILAFASMCVSISAYAIGGYFPVLYMLSFAVFIVLVLLKLSNILFLARTSFIGLIGYYPIFIKTIASSEALFSMVEFSTQGFSIALTMYALTSLALLGNEIGLMLGGRNVYLKEPIQPVREKLRWRIFFWCCVPVVILTAVLIADSGGPSLLDAGYATEGHEGLLGNMNSIGIIGLLTMIVALSKCRITHGKIIFIGLALCLLGWSMFMRGYRQDVLTALLGIYVCYAVANRKHPSITIQTGMVVFVLVVAFEIWGAMRAFISLGGFNVIEAIDQIISASGGERGVYHFGSVSPVATTFANVVYLIDEGKLHFLYGMSYFEYILRSPPEFMYPDRPKDYALIFESFGLISIGGFFELAEAYLNFGFFGALIIPALISFLISRSYWNAYYKQSIFSFFFLFSFLAVFFRGTWYQTFAFYKAWLTSIIIFYVFRVAAHIIKTVLTKEGKASLCRDTEFIPKNRLPRVT